MIIDGYLAAGAGIALLSTAPVGPATTLCINRTLGVGIRSGLWTGAGAVAALLACSAAMLGLLRMIEPSLPEYQSSLRWIGALLVLATTVRLLLQREVPEWAGDADARSPLVACVSSLVYNISHNIVLVPAVVALAIGVGIGVPDSTHMVSVFLGIGLGSTLWWMAVTLLTAATRGGLDTEALSVINWIFVACLLGFGMMSLFSGRVGI